MEAVANNNREKLYQEIKKMIRNLGCIFDEYSFHKFVMSNDPRHNEFRLSGRFGFGFKLKKRNTIFYFDQYREEETKESVRWIEEHNARLNALCSNIT